MKRFSSIVGIAALLLSATASVAQEDKKQDDRVRAKEPTVVTVEGEADRVKTDDTRNVGGARKVGRGIKNGAAAVWNGIVGFMGFSLGVDEDIPSKREREREAKEQKK
jgi:hypothetical protein